MHRPRVLIVDDDLAIIKLLRANLKTEGYEILTAMDGAEALETIERKLPDFMILDLMLPKIDGFEVCRRLREWSQIPIIILSARGDERDKIKCLDLGADDYMTKPFGANELISRIRAVLRRTTLWDEHPEPTFCYHDLVIDFARHKVSLAGKQLDLTATEYRILSYLARNAGCVVTPNQILEKVWGEDYVGEYHLLQVNMARLRQKLKDDTKNPRYILTRHGIGYMMKNQA